MTPNDSELLRRYVRDRSEAAFAELVRRHLDLVYSSALRQINGDVHAAQDVAQAVFLDLARKAARLTRHSSLSGWLYTSTRYLTANARRAAQRRLVRELTAHTMNELQRADEAEPDWSALHPILDDAMHELNETDREAVLWRYFERRPFAEIGLQLGLKENAARMRVERALDKLRAALIKRGVNSTGAALATMLVNQAVASTPADLAQRVCLAVTAAAEVGGVVAWRAALWASMKIKLAVGAGVAMLLVCALVWWQFAEPKPGIPSSPDENGTSDTVLASQLSSNDSVSGATGELEPAPPLDQNKLHLLIVAAGGGQPVSGVDVSCDVLVGKDSNNTKFRSDRNGSVQIVLPTNTMSLEIRITSEGFADTRLAWRTDRGEVIPREYVLRLTAPVSLGGSVVDAEGWPVSGAQVTMHWADNPIDAPRPETHTAWVKVSTDAGGRWHTERVAPELVRQLRVFASHPDHAESLAIRVATDAETERQMREGTLVLHLGAAGTVRGLVVDPDGNPVNKAKVLIGKLYYSDSKKLETAADGSFEVRGCARGKAIITVEANGFAATGAEADVDAAEPVRIVLSRGKSLLVKVIDREGLPVAGAGVGVSPALERSGSRRDRVPQFALDTKTDADGKVLMPHVPDMDLNLGVWADGYMNVCGMNVPPDERELQVTLPPVLTVSGTVRDATTGKLVPKFQIVTGRPEMRGPYWSTIDRFHPTFEGGTFRHVYDEAVVCEATNSGYLLKFEADGYAPYVSRLIAPDERSVQLEIALQPAESRQLIVVNPDGTPASWADVGLPELAKNNSLLLVPGGFDVSYNRTDGARQKTDQQGRFKVPASEPIRRVVIASSAGYADVSIEGLADGATVQLQPWGRIEGDLPGINNQSTQNEVTFSFHGTHAPEDGIWVDPFSGFRVKPDSTGHFVLPMVPPGRHGVQELIPFKNGWSHGRKLEIEVLSGQTVQATFNTNAVPNTAGNHAQ
ncbi:MAG: sigma-70 family RNA polymerase sigma factor [Verrucomicrobia bacterium]|nr:sigma-70 family RNA polymerase sigma factor [Verrucomicrobiota bacterium]